MSTQAAHQPRGPDGRWTQYLPEPIAITNMPDFSDTFACYKEPETAQPYLKGTTHDVEKLLDWTRDNSGEDKVFRWKTQDCSSPTDFSVSFCKKDGRCAAEGPFNVMWEEMPALWEALGDFANTTEERSNLASSVLSSLVSASDINLPDKSRHWDWDSTSADIESTLADIEQGINLCANFLGLPTTFQIYQMVGPETIYQMVGPEANTHNLYMDHAFRCLDYFYNSYGRKLYEGIDESALSDDSRQYFELLDIAKNRFLQSASCQIATQKVADRLGHIPMCPVNWIPEIRDGEKFLCLPDVMVSQQLRLYNYDIWGADGCGLLRYCSNSESGFTSHIFEPNLDARFCWRNHYLSSSGNKPHDSLYAFECRNWILRPYHQFFDDEYKKPGNCRVTDVLLGRSTPPGLLSKNSEAGITVEPLRIPLALHVMAKCDIDDPLREKSENWVKEMGFEPIAAQHINDMLSLSPMHEADAQAGVRLAEAWQEFQSDREDYSWYANTMTGNPDSLICREPEDLLTLAYERLDSL